MSGTKQCRTKIKVARMYMPPPKAASSAARCYLSFASIAASPARAQASSSPPL